MRFHFPNHPQSETENPHSLWSFAARALDACQLDGTIAPHVGFRVLEEKARRGPGRALEIQLEASERDRGRRAGNSGSYGAMQAEHDGYAATYDEWGFFIEKMYSLTLAHSGYGEFFVGSPKYMVYRDREHFHHVTGRTYDPTYVDYVGMYGDDYPYRQGRKQIGRRGAGRVSYDDPRSLRATEDPRDAEWLQAFQAGEVF